MDPSNNPSQPPQPGNLLLIRTFDAPRALVFAAWTDPKHLAHWWGPHGFTNPRCEWEVRPGGRIHVDMRGPNGTVYPMGGTYREVAAPERIVFTAGALDAEGRFLFEILNTVTFAELGGRTTVTLQTELLQAGPDAATYLSGHRAGWDQSLERFAALFPGEPDAGPASGRELVMSRTFTAPRELVWEAMMDPRHIIQWWGPRGFTTTIEVMDVRPGGAWNLTMKGPDGTEYPNFSIFTEVAKPERIAFSHGGGRAGEKGADFEAVWTFDSPAPDQTTVTIRMVFLTPGDRDRLVREYGAEEGGHQTLARLGEFLTDAPVVVERTFQADPATLWAALTEREAVREWYFDLEGFVPEVGCQFRFVVEHAGNTFDHRCRVTEVIPERKIAYTWRFEGHEGDSLVTFELFPEGEQTRLKLTHAGLGTFPLKSEFARTNFERGWASLINTCLPEYLASAAKVTS